VLNANTDENPRQLFGRKKRKRRACVPYGHFGPS
jgi:hypothetical protein